MTTPTAPGADHRPVADHFLQWLCEGENTSRETWRRIAVNLRDTRQALAAERARADKAEAERDEARMANERDRSNVAVHLDGLRKAMEGRSWLREAGRGSYAYDDDRYQEEFGHALDEIGAAVEPLRRIARDWTHCPSDPAAIKAARTSDALTAANTRIRELKEQRDMTRTTAETPNHGEEIHVNKAHDVVCVDADRASWTALMLFLMGADLDRHSRLKASGMTEVIYFALHRAERS